MRFGVGSRVTKSEVGVKDLKKEIGIFGCENREHEATSRQKWKSQRLMAQSQRSGRTKEMKSNNKGSARLPSFLDVERCR